MCRFQDRECSMKLFCLFLMATDSSALVVTNSGVMHASSLQLFNIEAPSFSLFPFLFIMFCAFQSCQSMLQYVCYLRIKRKPVCFYILCARTCWDRCKEEPAAVGSFRFGSAVLDSGWKLQESLHWVLRCSRWLPEKSTAAGLQSQAMARCAGASLVHGGWLETGDKRIPGMRWSLSPVRQERFVSRQDGILHFPTERDRSWGQYDSFQQNLNSICQWAKYPLLTNLFWLWPIFLCSGILEFNCTLKKPTF